VYLKKNTIPVLRGDIIKICFVFGCAVQGHYSDLFTFKTLKALHFELNDEYMGKVSQHAYVIFARSLI